MAEGIIVIPLSFVLPQKRRFKPKWFGAADYLDQKVLTSTPRLSPPRFLVGLDANGRRWITLRSMG